MNNRKSLIINVGWRFKCQISSTVCVEMIIDNNFRYVGTFQLIPNKNFVQIFVVVVVVLNQKYFISPFSFSCCYFSVIKLIKNNLIWFESTINQQILMMMMARIYSSRVIPQLFLSNENFYVLFCNIMFLNQLRLYLFLTTLSGWN